MKNSGLPASPFSRRSLLQAAGVIAAAGTGITASPATAAAAPTSDDHGGDGEHQHALVIYPVPAGVRTNDSFGVKVRIPGGEWQSVGVYLAPFKVIDPKSGHGTLMNSSMAYFDFTGRVEVSVTHQSAEIRTAHVRPLSYGIEPQVNEHKDEVRFALSEPRNLSIEINGDRFDNLQLFAGAIDPNPPSADDPNVIYYGPGVHTVKGGLTVPSGKTVYLAGGAVLNGAVTFSTVSNAKLLGRGVIYGGSCTVEFSQNIEIDGVTWMKHAITAGQAQNLTVRNVRALSGETWGDGIDLFSCQNVLIDGVFLRTSDDSFAVYNHRGSYYGDSADIVLQNSTLWADVAHPVNVGTHGDSDAPETIERLTISNIDILDHREPQVDYQGCIALNPGDGNLIRDVRIEDVRVEDFRWGQLINMRVMNNKKYNTSAGRGIDTVYIKNLSYNGNRASTSIMTGYDETHLIQNITFENLVINGVLISDKGHAPWYRTSDYVPMYTNEHVQNLQFIGPATPATGVPAITSPLSATATVGKAFSYAIAAAPDPYVYSATNLPAGLSVDTTTGRIAGTPTAAGTYAVVIAATNAAGAGSATLTLTVE